MMKSLVCVNDIMFSYVLHCSTHFGSELLHNNTLSLTQYKLGVELGLVLVAMLFSSVLCVASYSTGSISEAQHLPAQFCCRFGQFSLIFVVIPWVS